MEEAYKLCKHCGEEKPLSEFVRVKTRSGRGGMCKVCKNLKQVSYREKTENVHSKQYEKTLNGYLMRTYRNMLSRVTGVLKTKEHLYKGLEILKREEFYKWSLESNYPYLLQAYEASGYDMKLAPSIDREDSSLGYVIGNIRWVTHSENSRDGANSKRRKYS